MSVTISQQQALKAWKLIFERLLELIESIKNFKGDLPKDLTRHYSILMWNSDLANIVKSFTPKSFTQEEKTKFELKVKRDYISVANRVIDRVAEANGFFKTGAVDPISYHTDFLTYLKTFVL